jgi:hypothetical protein
MRHEVSPDHLVIEVPLFENLVVEEVPEWTMADVMEESRDPERLFNQRRRRRIRERDTE